MIRKKKRYVKPRKMYEKARILEENKLMLKYALKSKREIWKTLAKVNYLRHRAMNLSKAPIEEQEVLFKKIKAIGLKANSISDVLALKVEDLLERRLPTIVAELKLANTPKQARQFVVHKSVLISDRIVNIPSYIVPVAEEKLITLKIKNKLSKQEDEKISKSEEKGENNQ